MNRTEVIQQIINKKMARSYLEIGVYNGKNFFPIKAWRKIAVDPLFQIEGKKRLKWLFKNFYNIGAKYHETTSDNYFANATGTKPFDVIFIDGLHTYAQSLKDVINSLNILADNGVIIMHDCSPPHEDAAFPAQSLDHADSLNLPGWTGEWCGDVWKTICYLRSFRKDLQVFVLDCDFGVGIITKGNPSSSLNLTENEIDKMSYGDLETDRKTLLNLKSTSFFPEFLDKI